MRTSTCSGSGHDGMFTPDVWARVGRDLVSPQRRTVAFGARLYCVRLFLQSRYGVFLFVNT